MPVQLDHHYYSERYGYPGDALGAIRISWPLRRSAISLIVPIAQQGQLNFGLSLCVFLTFGLMETVSSN